MAVPALNSTHKTNLNNLEAAITAAIASLTNPSDAWQSDARAVLDRLRRDIELLRDLRRQ